MTLAFIAPQEQLSQKISLAHPEKQKQVEEPLHRIALMELLALFTEKAPVLETQLFADLKVIIVLRVQLHELSALQLVRLQQTEPHALPVLRENSVLLEK